MWKIIDDAGMYSVNENGEVRNNNTGRMIKPVETYNGYLRVGIHGRLCRIHRLVAEAFIDNPCHFTQVNHKDGNKRNNNVANLEWVTASQNAQHAFEHNLREVNYTGIHDRRPVFQMALDGTIIQRYESIIDAERATGCNNSTISKVCKGKQRITHGYKWRYADL